MLSLRETRTHEPMMKARFRIELDLSRRRSSWIVPDPGRHPNIDFILAQERSRIPGRMHARVKSVETDRWQGRSMPTRLKG